MSVEDAEGALLVSGSPIEQVGDAAAAAGLALHELSAQAGSLEQAFMQLTGQAVEFPTHVVAGMTPPAADADGQVPPAPAPESTASRHSAPEGL
jgi:ABC-2 type transport system ATP-binding protein